MVIFENIDIDFDIDKAILKQARKLQATLVRNYDLLTYSLMGVRCRATSVAKKNTIWDGGSTAP